MGVSEAVVEELIFRGFVQRSLTPVTGPAVAVGVTALAFSACHAPLLAVGVTSASFFLGWSVFVGWMALRTGRLLPSTCFHAAYNVFAAICVSWQPAADVLDSVSPVVWWLVLATSLCAARSGVTQVAPWPEASGVQR